MKHVLAGSEYLAATGVREEKALVFGDNVDEKKYTSCKPRGNDPRFSFLALLPLYLKCIFPWISLFSLGFYAQSLLSWIGFKPGF